MPSNEKTIGAVPTNAVDIVRTTPWSAGDAVPPCKHTTLVADDHDDVKQINAATCTDAVLSTVAKLRPVTVRPNKAVKGRLMLWASLTAGAANMLVAISLEKRHSAA